MSALIDTDENVRQRVMEIAEEIGKQNSVSPLRMLRPERTPSVVKARNELMAALWRTGYSVSEVASILGMDRASILYGLRKSVGPEQYRTAMLARRGARVRVSP